jgi:hypothetical protein
MRPAQAVEQNAMQPVPDPGGVPIAQPPPARHPRTAAHLLRQHLPGNAALEHKQNAAQRRPARQRRPAALRPGPIRRQQRFDNGPLLVGHKRLGHASQNGPLAPPFPVLLGVLSVSPLISGLVAEMFGTRYMATLLGISFVMHQAGSSLGAWGGGLIFTATGSYDTAWKIGVLIGLTAGVIQILAGGPSRRPGPTIIARPATT